jgi:deazaflavin-dependent oxidoreductase (nitroreductase family)
MPRWVTRLHTWVYRRSGGRVLGRMGGQPVLLLQSTERRSGQTHITPVQYLADGDTFVVVASNAGAVRPPAWYLNLRADPHARVGIGPRTVDIRAHEATVRSTPALATADDRQPLPGTRRAQGPTRPAPHDPHSLNAHNPAAGHRPLVTTTPVPTRPFTSDALAGLDEPIPLYVSHGISDGAPLPHGVLMAMSRRIKVGLWQPRTADLASRDCHTWSRCSRTSTHRRHSESRSISTPSCPQRDRRPPQGVYADREVATRVASCYFEAQDQPSASSDPGLAASSLPGCERLRSRPRDGRSGRATVVSVKADLTPAPSLQSMPSATGVPFGVRLATTLSTQPAAQRSPAVQLEGGGVLLPTPRSEIRTAHSRFRPEEPSGRALIRIAVTTGVRGTSRRPRRAGALVANRGVALVITRACSSARALRVAAWWR